MLRNMDETMHMEKIGLISTNQAECIVIDNDNIFEYYNSQ